MDRSRWKLIKIGWWSGQWVGECFFWYRLTRVVPPKGHKTTVVFVVVATHIPMTNRSSTGCRLSSSSTGQKWVVIVPDGMGGVICWLVSLLKLTRNWSRFSWSHCIPRTVALPADGYSGWMPYKISLSSVQNQTTLTATVVVWQTAVLHAWFYLNTYHPHHRLAGVTFWPVFVRLLAGWLKKIMGGCSWNLSNR